MNVVVDVDRLTQEITESAKRADGVRYPSDRETNLTIELIQKCWEAFHGQPPQESEWVKIGEEFQRIGYVWSQEGDITEFQPCKNGSHYLCNGHGSFSGSFEYLVKMKLVHVGWKLAHFWKFYGGSSGAHRGVHFSIPVRVFAEVEVTNACRS